MANLLSTTIAGSLTVDTNVLYVDSTNNLVGIGTTSPTAPLTFANVAGNKIDLYHTTASGGDRYGVQVQNSELRIHSGALGDASGGITFGKSNTSTFTEAMRITNAGNVGIGTTSPVANLHVNSSTTESVLQLTTSTSGALISDGLRIAMIGNVAAFLLRESADMWFATSNTERLRITSAGNVGIGTTSPVAKLTVLAASTGYSSDSQIKISDGSTSYYGGLSFDDSGATRLSIRNSYDGTGSVIGFGFGSSADKVQIVDGTGLIVNEGNVGIGTTSPTGKLEILGSDNQLILNTAGTYSSIYFRNNGNNVGQLFSTNTSTYLTTIGARTLYLGGGNATQQMTLDGTNVGIGTTSPGAALQIYSGLKLYSNGVFTWGNSSNYGTLTWDGARTIVKAQVSKELHLGANNSDSNVVIDTTGNVGIGTTSPSEKLHVNGNIKANGSISVTNIVTNRIVKFNGSVLDDSLLYDNGTNVGIGTISPSYKLHVDDNTAYGGIFIEGDNAPGLTIRDNSGTSQSIIYVQSTAGSQGNLRISSDNNNTATTPTIEFLVGGSEKMRILDGGNVGIGTTSPEFKLKVVGGNGNQLGLDNAGERFTQISFLENGSQNSAIWLDGTDNMFDIYTNTNHGIRLKTGGDNTRLTVTSGGNVLIGATTDAGYKLYLNGNQGTVGTSFYLGTLNSTAIAIDHSGVNTWRIGVNNSNTSTFSIGNDLGGTFASKYLNITNAGNVGIGTTSPGYKLETIGNARISGNLSIGTTYNGFAANIEGIVYVINGSVWVNDGYGYANASSTNTGMFPDSSHNITFKTNNSARVYINSSGNVGIGTTTPASELDVNGTVNANIFSVMGTAGYTGVVTFPGNPPGMQNLDFQGGILVNVF